MAPAPSASRSALRHPACRILSLAFLLLAAPVAAQVLVNGDEFRVNTYTPSYQGAEAVAFGAGGSFVVVWASYGSGGPDQDGWGIVARRFDARGVPLGDEFQINSYTTGRQVVPRVAADAQGNFVVVWESYGSVGDDSWRYSIQARRFDAAGAPLGPQFQVNTYTTDDQQRPGVAVLSPQGFVVTWESEGSADGDSSATSVQARRYAADGAPLGDEFQVNTLTTGLQDLVAVTGEPQGGFAVTWKSQVSAGTDTSFGSVQARLFDAEGTPLGSEIQVNAYTTGTQGHPAISAGPQGEFVIVWQSAGSYEGDTFSVQLRRFDSGLSPLGDELQVNVSTPGVRMHPSVKTDPAGDFLVAWNDYDRIVARRYAPDGTPKSGEVQVNVAGSVAWPEVAADARGNFVVAWTSDRVSYPDPDAGSEVTARRIDSLFRDGVESGDTARWSVSQP